MNNKQTNPALHPYTLPEGVVLEAKDIVTTFYSDGQRAEAVTGSGLTLKQGEIIGLVGESGSGKSVTSMSILQLIMPPGKIESGEVYLKGHYGQYSGIRLQKQRDAQHPRRQNRYDLPGAYDLVEPGADHRLPDSGNHHAPPETG